MTNQVLSIEKMRHLQELGVDMSDASMYWVKRLHNPNIEDESKKEWFLSLQKEFMTFGRIAYKVLPTFTLQDILDKLPKCIITDDYEFELNIYYHESGVSVFYDNGDIEQLVFFSESTILESAYQMLCWCAENGYLKGGEG